MYAVLLIVVMMIMVAMVIIMIFMMEMMMELPARLDSPLYYSQFSAPTAPTGHTQTFFRGGKRKFFSDEADWERLPQDLGAVEKKKKKMGKKNSKLKQETVDKLISETYCELSNYLAFVLISLC